MAKDEGTQTGPQPVPDPPADDEQEQAPATEGNGGASIREMAEREATDAEQVEMFPMGTLEGDGVNHKNLMRANEPVEFTIAMTGGEVPSSSGGMMDPRKESMLLVTVEPEDGGLPVPRREGDRITGKTVKGWKVRQKVRPIFIERVEGQEGVIEANFQAFLEADAQRAAALLDRLAARTKKALE